MKKLLCPVDYSKTKIPTDYKCCKCRAKGVKLWRLYQTFLDHQELTCAKCSAKLEKENISDMNEQGQHSSPIPGGMTVEIGWRVPAVPTEEGDTYWGHCSVPEAGWSWWEKLPLRK